MRPLFLPARFLVALSPVFFEALDKRAVAFVRCCRLVHDDNIKAFECILVMSK